uniref:F-box associated domain-containing protein n=1 Tax=Aegilops tauschii TaxID=37682 RepID=M8AP22_AEGTA
MSSTSIAAAFDYVGAECSTIKQHCNGLLLLDNEWPRGRAPIKEKAWVLNPATRGWERLPPPPPICTPGMEDVFDFYIEKVMRCHNHHEYYMEDHVAEREWPPSTFILLVFSSRTKRWEERPFIRQGEAAATIGYMFDDFPCPQCYAACWLGALYVHQNGFILRMTLSNDKYRVIELPEGFCGMYTTDLHLGKSENGVYCALLDGHGGPRLRIWYLDETCDQINWRSKCDINLDPLLAEFSGEHSDTYSEQCYNRGSLLGFHPNEETVFLHTPLKRVVAYHFDSSKMEDLGCLPVEPRDHIYVSFPYTLCLMGEFSSNQ